MKLNALRHEVRFIMATFQNVMIYILKNLSRIFETFSFRGRTFLAFIFWIPSFFCACYFSFSARANRFCDSNANWAQVLDITPLDPQVDIVEAVGEILSAEIRLPCSLCIVFPPWLMESFHPLIMLSPHHVVFLMISSHHHLVPLSCILLIM